GDMGHGVVDLTDTKALAELEAWQVRANHFVFLNDYRYSKEYQEWNASIGGPAPQADLEPIIGLRWDIDEAIYNEFLGMLPPLGWNGSSFYMSEFSFSNITTKYSRVG